MVNLDAVKVCITSNLSSHTDKKENKNNFPRLLFGFFQNQRKLRQRLALVIGIALTQLQHKEMYSVLSYIVKVLPRLIPRFIQVCNKPYFAINITRSTFDMVCLKLYIYSFKHTISVIALYKTSHSKTCVLHYHTCIQLQYQNI